VKLFVWTDVLGGGMAIAVADTRDEAITQVIETARTRLEADLAADRPKLRDLTAWTGYIHQDLKGIEAQLTRHEPAVCDPTIPAAWYSYGSES
jgi:hypothetical protein